MDKDYIDIIVDKFKEVLQELDIEVKKVMIGNENILKPKKAVAVTIGLIGDIKGRVIIYMAEKVAIKIASIMNFEELEGLDSLVLETISELANMTVARGVMAFNNMGKNMDLSPPTTFYGENLKFFDLDDSNITKLATIFTDNGFIFLTISLSQIKEGD